MVMLIEYAPGAGVAQKRKGAEDPGQLACPGDGDLGSCRATKMRRLECAGTGHDHVPAAVEMGSDVSMGEEPPAPPLGAPEGERALVVYGGPGVDAAPAGGRALLGKWRLRPWAPVSAGAEWICDMLREADSRTVRAVLSGAQEQEEGGADLAVVPWVAAPALAEADQASTAAETVDEVVDAEGAAAMDVEEEMEMDQTHQTQTLAAGSGGGYLWRWPQHCFTPPPPLPAVGQASPAVWSW